MLYYRFGFRIRVMNLTSGIEYESAWGKKIKRGRGILAISRDTLLFFSLATRETPPTIYLSLSTLPVLFLLLSPSFRRPLSSKPRRFLPPSTCKFPHSTTPTSWHKFSANLGRNSKLPATFMKGFGHRIEAWMRASVKPCNLASSCFQSSINWGENSYLQIPNSISILITEI